jgi:hypothetical protein
LKHRLRVDDHVRGVSPFGVPVQEVVETTDD